MIDAQIPGRVVELGSGIGALKTRLQEALLTDLFPNPGLDLVCDGYDMPLHDGAVSHLILFDVFHHLATPGAFFKEAHRVVAPGGRIILFEPYISQISLLAYGLFHHEPVAYGKPIDLSPVAPKSRLYYAAQGNATRLFFRQKQSVWPPGWSLFHAEAFACFSYLFSGGFSLPAFYPRGCLNWLQRIDAALSRWPRVFGGRCLIGLRRED